MPSYVDAVTIVTQGISSTQSTDVDTSGIQTLGSGLSGTITNFQTYASGVSSLGFFGHLEVILYSFTSSNYGSGTTTVWSKDFGEVTASKALYSTTTPQIVLDPTKYYAVKIACGVTGCGPDFYTYGSGSNVYSGGAYTNNFSGTSYAGLADVYFLFGGLTNLSATSTRIVSQNTPTNGQIFSNGDLVTFDYDYYFNSVQDFGRYDTAGILLSNVTIGQSLNTPTSTIVSSGVNTYSEEILLPNNSCFIWRPFLTGSGGQITGDIFSFCIGTVPQTPFPDNYQQPYTDEEATTTLFANMSSVFDIWKTLDGKFPFNWVTGIITDFSALQVSGTPDFEPVILDLAALDLELWDYAAFAPIRNSGYFTITLFSTTSMMYPATLEGWSSLYLMVEYIMWIVFALDILGMAYALWSRPTI